MSLSIKDQDPYTQLRLLDEPDMIKFPTPASARTRYGEVAEQIACTALRAVNITNDGRCDVCYDAKRGKHYFEIKSVRANGECPIYEWRIEKDLNCGKPVLYAFVLHECRGCRDSIELWKAMAATVKHIYVVPLKFVHELQHASKLESIHKQANSRNGYEREGYCKGYRRVKMASVKDLPNATKGRRFPLNGHRFNLQIHTVS